MFVRYMFMFQVLTGRHFYFEMYSEILEMGWECGAYG